MSEELNNFKIENGAFKGFNKEIRIPSGVRRIAPLALAPLSGMEILVLPDTLERLEPTDLREPYDTSSKRCPHIWGSVNARPSSLREIRISGENQYFRSKNGALYSADGKRLIYMPPQHHGETVEIAEGVEELCEESCCFVNARITVFPKTLRRISAGACCSSDLKRSRIPSCELGESAFQGSVLPEYLDIYNEVLPPKAFANCSALKGVYLHDSVKLIKNEAFSYTDIEKIYIPPTTQIEENAFVREEMRRLGNRMVRLHENGFREVKYDYEYYSENYKGVIVGGELGSPAEKFAVTNGIKFEVVGSSEEQIRAWLGWQDGVDAAVEKGAAYYENENGELVAFDKDSLPF